MAIRPKKASRRVVDFISTNRREIQGSLNNMECPFEDRALLDGLEELSLEQSKMIRMR